MRWKKRWKELDESTFVLTLQGAKIGIGIIEDTFTTKNI